MPCNVKPCARRVPAAGDKPTPCREARAACTQPERQPQMRTSGRYAMQRENGAHPVPAHPASQHTAATGASAAFSPSRTDECEPRERNALQRETPRAPRASASPQINALPRGTCGLHPARATAADAKPPHAMPYNVRTAPTRCRHTQGASTLPPRVPGRPSVQVPPANANLPRPAGARRPLRLLQAGRGTRRGSGPPRPAFAAQRGRVEPRCIESPVRARPPIGQTPSPRRRSAAPALQSSEERKVRALP